MHEVLKEFLLLLSQEEENFKKVIAADDTGILLRTAINEFDWYYYNINNTENPTDEQYEQFYFAQLGLPKFIRFALEREGDFIFPALTFTRNMKNSRETLSLVVGLAFIEHGRRVAYSVSKGLCEIRKTGENSFEFLLPKSITDNQYFERHISEHYKTFERERFSYLLSNTRLGKKLSKSVQKILTKLVYVFKEHYIGYEAHPKLDIYFFGIAYHELQLHDGFDTFHFGVKFGGVSFQKYILATAYFLSLALKHEQFCHALVKKAPSIKLENILTVSADNEGFVESISDAVNYFGESFEGHEAITIEEANIIFDVLSVHSKNVKVLDHPIPALPYIIRPTQASFVKLLAGARQSPIQFLLDSLRHHFPQEYDREQRSREKVMQRAIKRIMNDVFSGLIYIENIKLRLEKRILTDIDLTIIDQSTGSIILCQLKHQDLYGADYKAEHNRNSRLKEEIKTWISAIDEWIHAVGDDGVKSALQLKRSFEIRNISRLIVTRHYAYALHGEVDNGQSVIFCNYLQLLNAIESIKPHLGNQAGIDRLLHLLFKQNTEYTIPEHLPEPTLEYNLVSMKFVVQQQN